MGCYKSTVVSAPVNKVWALFQNFHDLAWADGVVSKVEIVGDAAGGEIGAKRILNGAFYETMRMLDNENRIMEYSIDDGPAAVSKENVQGYIGRVKVSSVTDSGATFVEWSSRWTSGGEGAVDFCNPIYRALLDALNSHFS